MLVRALAGTGAVRMGAMIASFIVGIQLARGLGVEGYGYYGIALSILTIVGVPAELGLPRLVTREVAAASARKNYPHLLGVLRWANRTATAISLVMALGVVVAALVLLDQGKQTLGLSLLFGAPMIPLMALARIRGGGLQGLHHIVRGQIPATLLRAVLLSLLLLGAAALGVTLDPPAAIALYSVTAAAVFLLAHVWLRQRLPTDVSAEVVKGGRQWIASSIPMSLSDGMRTVQKEVSILIVGLIVAPAAVGLFRIAYMTVMMAAVPVQVVARVGLPVMAQLHAQNERERLQKVVTAFAFAQLAGVTALSLPLLLFAAPLLSFAFGRDFADAADALRILAIGQIINAAFGPNAALLNMTNLERRVTRALAITLPVTAIAVSVLVYRWGITGAATGLVASTLCWNILVSRDAWRLLGIDTSGVVATLRRLS
ncbi:MAG: oligosaccharide flippase family protein [Pseudomonadota bacterium]|nr:oligosaccharide flippase family protein [Sphingomonas sp.]MDQ3479326.1 oligosaccharide flippase family protein [Pseudomonadota bacterium]